MRGAAYSERVNRPAHRSAQNERVARQGFARECRPAPHHHYGDAREGEHDAAEGAARDEFDAERVTEDGDEGGCDGDEQSTVGGGRLCQPVDEKDLVNRVADEPQPREVEQLAARDVKIAFTHAQDNQKQHGGKSEARRGQGERRDFAQGEFDDRKVRAPNRHDQQHRSVCIRHAARIFDDSISIITPHIYIVLFINRSIGFARTQESTHSNFGIQPDIC